MARKGGLPKKYAKMGFKKGWKAYKATKRKTSTITRSRTRTTTRRRPMARRRKYTRRAKSFAGGAGMKPLIDGAIAGIAAEAGQKFIGGYGAPLGIAAVGMWRRNATLKTIAGMQLGSLIGDKIPMIGGGGSALGGFE